MRNSPWFGCRIRLWMIAGSRKNARKFFECFSALKCIAWIKNNFLFIRAPNIWKVSHWSLEIPMIHCTRVSQSERIYGKFTLNNGPYRFCNLLTCFAHFLLHCKTQEHYYSAVLTTHGKTHDLLQHSGIQYQVCLG